MLMTLTLTLLYGYHVTCMSPESHEYIVPVGISHHLLSSLVFSVKYLHVNEPQSAYKVD